MRLVGSISLRWPSAGGGCVVEVAADPAEQAGGQGELLGVTERGGHGVIDPDAVLAGEASDAGGDVHHGAEDVSTAVQDRAVGQPGVHPRQDLLGR